jgi:hypothetical protein
LSPYHSWWSRFVPIIHHYPKKQQIVNVAISATAELGQRITALSAKDESKIELMMMKKLPSLLVLPLKIIRNSNHW